jgi:hypothetical protein
MSNLAVFLNWVLSLLSSIIDLGGRPANTLWMLVICSACFELVVFLSYLSVEYAVLLRCNSFCMGLLSLLYSTVQSTVQQDAKV